MASAACTPGPASRLMAILLSSHKEVLFVGNSFVTRFSRYFTREIIIVYVFPAVWWWRPHRGGGRTSILSLHSGGCSLPLQECVRMFYPDVHCFLSLAVDSPISPSFPNSLSLFFSIIVGYGEYVSHLLLHLAVCWLLHIWLSVLLSRSLVRWRMCVSTHSRLDMTSSDLLCDMDISFSISHGFARSGHICVSPSFTSISCIPGSAHSTHFFYICIYQRGSRAVNVSIHSTSFVFVLPIYHTVHILLQLSSVSVVHECVYMYEPLSSLKINPILSMTYWNLFHLDADSDPSKPGPTALVLAFSP